MIELAPNLALPLDVVTKTVGILAQRRKGKTYTANVIAEEMVANGVPFVALDPTGAWWGLRASADGQHEGLPVTILGGQHGDVPLERTAGKLVAELVVDQPGWYVLDLSLLGSHEADRQFATDFATRLYRRKGQPGGDTPLHLFVDEADLFVPQRVPSGDTTMLGAFEALVRRGGLRGIGTTLISQRSAVVNKNVLEQLDMLIVLRTVGPNDRKRIDEIVTAEGTPEQVAALRTSIASLELGEAWVWEPGEGLFDRVRIRERRTFNSSSTPKTGETRIEPKRLAPVDLDALKDQMAATIERAAADDPKKLRARIVELEREARAQKPAPAPEPIIETIEIPVVPPAFTKLLDELVGSLQSTLGVVQRMHDTVASASHALPTPPRTPNRVPTSRSPRLSPPSKAPDAAPAPVDADLGGGAPSRILAVLAQFPNGRTKRQVAALAGLAVRKSTIRNALSALRTRGYLDERGDLFLLTSDGLAAAGGAEPLPTGPELLAYWRAEVGGQDSAPRRIFDALLDAYPNALSRDELVVQTGDDGSTQRNALSKLRSLDLIEGKGQIRIPDELMAAIS